MARSPVEKYEQIIAADPGSLVFVDLARSLIERGDAQRATEVCRDGIVYHPGSIAGLVTWGRALLALGRASEAMERFEQAIAVDRKNPYAYNLIGELLVQKRLHRSALPILEKAVALQPADAKVRGWLDQTRRALGIAVAEQGEGPSAVPETEDGPAAPVQPESGPAGPRDGAAAPALDAPAPAEADAAAAPAPAAPVEAVTDAAAPGEPPAMEAPAESGGARDDSGFDETLDMEPAGPAATPAPARPAAADGLPVTARTRPDATPGQGVRVPPPRLSRSPAPDATAAPAPAAPRSMAAFRSELPPDPDEPTYVPMPGVDAPALVVVDPFHSIGDAASDEDPGTAPPAGDAAPGEEGPEGGPPPLRGRGDISDPRIAPRPPDGPPVLRPPDRAIPPPLRHAPARTGALDHILPDLPPDPEPPPPAVAPPAEDPHAAAAEYERSLRIELDSVPQLPVRRSRRLVLTIAVAAAAAVASAGVAWLLLRSSRETDQILTAARHALARDTYAAYAASGRALDEVLADDPSNAEARALHALVLARLSVVYGSGDADRVRAAKILADPALMKTEPEVVLAARHLLAAGDDRRAVADEILARPADGAGALLHGLAGAVLLARDEPGKAIERFNSAMAAAPGHVPTLVRVGDYYSARGDHPEALRYYGLALTISEDHPGALLGAATSRLELGEGNAQESITSLGKLTDERHVPVADRLRLVLLRGRLLGAGGRKDEALQQLAGAAARVASAENARDVAAAYKEVGAVERAQEVLEAALPQYGQDARLRELYARVLLARENRAGVLALKPQKGERGLQVVRGIALYELGRYTKAREALRAAQSDKGKLPVEAVVYLSLIDLGSGKFEKARSNLERLARTATARSVTHRAYAQVLLRAGRPDEAERELRAALDADRHDYEARCALGRLLLSRGQLEAAAAELEKAVDQNPFHVEAGVALVQARLKRADVPGAASQAQTLLALAGEDARVLTAHAAVLLASGQAGQAHEQAARAVRLAPRSVDARLQLAAALSADGAPEAVPALEDAVKALPREPALRVALGEAHLAANDATRAMEAFDRALKLDRGSIAARVGRAEALAAQDRGKDAEKELRSALEVSRPTADEAALRAALASVLAHQGKARASQAEKEAARALQLDATCAPARLARGRALALLGRRKEATSELQRALELSPTGRVAAAARSALDRLAAK